MELPIKLDEHEKKRLTASIIEQIQDYEKNPDFSLSVSVDRILDDLNSILTNRKPISSNTKRLKPDDKGDDEQGRIYVKVD